MLSAQYTGQSMGRVTRPGGRPARRTAMSAVLGAAGSALLAISSDLPGSPYGPHAGGLWPLAIGGAAPGWEGSTVPEWMQPANVGTRVPPGRLLVTVVAVLGVLLLSVAWFGLWRSVRARPDARLRDLWWIFALWTAPLLLAAPFASQDVWIYGAQGKMALSGLGASRSVHLLGHSVWLSGVDRIYLTGPSVYGPGAVDLSALFVKISGGHPWIAVACWRLAVVAGLAWCAWAVHWAVSSRGGHGAAAVVGGVANPGVLIMFVASVHNDAVMIALLVVAIAMAVNKRPWLGLLLAALAVTIKAPAALGLLAVAWWGWRGERAGRLLGVLAGTAAALGALLVFGLFSGGGFGWIHSAAIGRVTSSFSIERALLAVTSPHVAAGIQLAGIVAAVALVVVTRRAEMWIGVLALSFAVTAVSAANPEPWYLLWALPVVAAAGLDERLLRPAVLVLCLVTAWSEMPLGTVVWFTGLAGAVWLWASDERRRRRARCTGGSIPTDEGESDRTRCGPGELVTRPETRRLGFLSPPDG